MLCSWKSNKSKECNNMNFIIILFICSFTTITTKGTKRPINIVGPTWIWSILTKRVQATRYWLVFTFCQATLVCIYVLWLSIEVRAQLARPYGHKFGAPKAYRSIAFGRTLKLTLYCFTLLFCLWLSCPH